MGASDEIGQSGHGCKCRSYRLDPDQSSPRPPSVEHRLDSEKKCRCTLQNLPYPRSPSHTVFSSWKGARMARKLQAKKITEALQQAQRVGEVEEGFTVAGCRIVLRNLPPEDFSEIIAETDELEEGLGYITSFKKGHICRSLIELNGESLREYDFVEVDIEEPDPVTKQPVKKAITLERHKFIYDYVLATWSREVIDVVYRKFLDVTRKSEIEAAEGVEFILPDETPDEKFRRLLVEVKDLEGQLPFELAKRVLEEIGYTTVTSKDEGERVNEVLARASEAQETPPEATQETPVQTAPEVAQPEPKTDLKSLLRDRKPLNQRAVSVPEPSPAPPPAQAEVYAPTEEAAPIHRVAPGQPIPVSPAALKRAQDIGNLEGFDPNEFQAEVPLGIQGGSRIVGTTVEGIPIPGEVSPNMTKEQGVLSVLNKPPAGPLNPRYRPQGRF